MNLDCHSSRFSRALACAVALALAVPLSAGAGGPDAAAGLRRLDGEPFSLEALRGRVVLLDFWAPWCIPCRRSFPFLDALQDRHEAAGLTVVGLTLESNEQAIRAFLDDVPVRFPIVRDPAERSGEEYGVVAMPTALLLDRQGHVVARFEGGDDEVHGRIEQAVASLLGGKALPAGAGVRVAASREATGAIKAWRRGYLADPIMNLDGDPLTRLLLEHIHASKEGASGDGGPAGGGCGCN